MNLNTLCINCFKETGGEQVCMHCGFLQTDRPRQACHLFPKTILNNRYIIGTVVNNGGFGVVYKAYDMKLETIVAIKELLPTQNGIVTRMDNDPRVIPLDEEKAQRFAYLKEKFLAEARTIAQFYDCDSIVRVKDFFEANDTAYYVMEYLDGITLSQYIKMYSGPMDSNSAIGIIKPIMEAVNVIHSANIVHRDISPDNIFITEDNRIKLIDFGEACVNESVSIDNVVLKPGFSPPEQYNTEDKAVFGCDIYSIGAVLYFMVTGERPQESIDRLKKDNLQLPSKKGVKIDSNVEKAIMKAMALRDSTRFKNVKDFILAIEGKKTVLSPEGEKKLKKTISAITVVFVTAIVLAGVLVTYFIQKSNSLIPDEETSIEVWYVENGDENQFENWSKIADDFAQYTAQQKDGKKVDVVFKGVKASEYAEQYEKAKDEGDAPDVYISSYAPTGKQSLGEEEGFEIESESASLKTLYNQIEKDVESKSTTLTPAFDVMKSEFEESNQFAAWADLPVLYAADVQGIASVNNLDLEGLINSEIPEKYSYSLVVNPNVVLDAAYAYGYDGGNTENLGKLYDSAKVKNPLKVFSADSKSALYYMGYISEYREIEKEYSAGKTFEVTALPGGKNNYIFPEIWSITPELSQNESKASMLFLYYLLSNESSQKSATRYGLYPKYLPMLQSYTDGNFTRREAYANVLDSQNKAMSNGKETQKRFDKATEITGYIKSKSDFKDVEEKIIRE